MTWGENFPKCHLMSEIFPPDIDSAETDETAGEEKHKTEEIIQLTGLQLKDKSGGERFNTLVWKFTLRGLKQGVRQCG